MNNTKDNWITISYDEMAPQGEEKFIKTILHPIKSYVSKRSRMRFSVEQRGEVLRGVLEVYTPTRNYISTNYDNDIYDLAEKAKIDMTWQIDAQQTAKFLEIAI